MKLHRVWMLPVGFSLVAGLVGCADESVPVVNEPVAKEAESADHQSSLGNRQGPQIQQAELDTEQLANILQSSQISAWTFKYSGGPIRCWLEIEESGQKTMPARIPEEGFVEERAKPQKDEGKILLWWKRGLPDSGTTIELEVADSGCSLGPDRFVFEWDSLTGVSTTVHGSPRLKPGQEVVLMTYEAKEDPDKAKAKEPGKPRIVKLLLKAKSARE